MKSQFQVRIALAVALLLTGVVAATAATAAASGAGVVNINSATSTELALLPRVGPAVAERILAFREDNGSFEAPEELMLVRGIGERTLELIEPYVVLKGETTATEKIRPATEASDEG